MDCDLCNAINEEDNLIFSNNHVFCVICKWPLKDGHVIVLPKRHVKLLDELDEIESMELLRGVEMMKKVLKEIYGRDTIVFQNSGRHSSQEHIHLHVLPSKGDLRKMVSKFEGIDLMKDIPNVEMSKMADRIKEGLNNFT